jgi:hypothetical protein
MRVKSFCFNRLARQLKSVLKISLLAVPGASAEIYISQGPDGERVVSDKPIPGYALLTQRDTFDNAGHIMAGRPLNDGGPEAYKTHIRNASEKYMVDAALIEAIIQVESSFRSDVVSSSGATGLMQLMPATARDLKVKDRYNARENIHGGVRYLSELQKRFNNNLTLVVAAYNAGPGAVERARGIPPRPEVQHYVNKVMLAYHKFRMIRYGSE